jgi:hypothetical protein
MESNLIVPFLDRKGVGDGEPIPMYFEVRGFTVSYPSAKLSGIRQVPKCTMMVYQAKE